MRKRLIGAAVMAAATAIPLTAVAAAGTPQRNSDIPPGLAKKLTDQNLGILRAVIATVGSNSRLQDLPVSP